MNIVDWVLIGMAAACAWIGFRQGLVTSLLSFVGFIAGAFVGALVVPGLVAGLVQVPGARPVTVVIGVILAGFAGQFIARFIGRRLRASVHWQSARLVDSIGGAVVTVLALAVTVWIVASALAALPANPVTAQVRTSRVLVLLDSTAPQPVRDALMRLRQVASNSAVPQLFANVAELTGQDVGTADATGLDLARLASLRRAVVEIHGNAAACAQSSSGSGFLAGKGLVVTNAHVVAGIGNIGVRQGNATQRATLIWFDPAQDVAVLRVTALSGAPLRLLGRAPDIGTDVAAVGFPAGGPLVAIPLRVRGNVDAVGDDLYGRSSVTRSLVALQGPPLAPGVSGSPVVTADGDVVAMLVGASTAKRDVGYAIPAFVLKDAVESAQQATEPVTQTTCVG